MSLIQRNLIKWKTNNKDNPNIKPCNKNIPTASNNNDSFNLCVLIIEKRIII